MLHGLHGAERVAGGASEPDEKADVTRDAIAHFTEPGEINKEPLFKERWQWIVQVPKLCEPPKVPCDLWILRSKPEKVGQHAEALFHLALQVMGRRGRVIGRGQ